MAAAVLMDRVKRMADLRIGISGWSYRSWRGLFYPAGLPAGRHLEYASRRLNSIEINASFYRLQKPESYMAWAEQTPPGFCFAVKGSAFITQNKKLRNTETALANFLASGVLILDEKLGPIVWQLPERLRFDAERIETFVAGLPRDTTEAAEIARKHDWRVEGRCWTEPLAHRRLRHALEIRHVSYLVPELVRILKQHGVALVFADSGRWPYVEEITADFIYMRLHGSPMTYASRYDDSALDWYAQRIQLWRSGAEPADAIRVGSQTRVAQRPRDVFVYFDNDGCANAAFDAMRLAERFGIVAGEVESPLARAG